MQEPICIVGMGCVLPGARNPGELWERLISGQPQFAPLPATRMDPSHFGPSQRVPTKPIPTNIAAYITDDRLPPLVSADWTRTDCIGIEAVRQVFAQVDSKVVRARRVETIFGNMTADETFYQSRFERRLFAITGTGDVGPDQGYSQFFERMQAHLDFEGPAYFVNAACASSLAAIQIGCHRLQNRSADIVIAGGVEANLHPGIFLSFSVIGALSTTGCRPFDRSHDGIVVGEGAAAFALQRLSDAQKDGHRILGVIRGLGSSSDGRAVSVFAPNLSSQLLCYQRAYEILGSRRVDYIEGHGTGTVTGDDTEIGSLGNFFGRFKIPFGSIKALLGHTRGTAGAAGLLKALLIAQHRVIPGSAYIEQLSARGSGSLFVNSESINLAERATPIRIGISAYGFGGTNVHLVIDEYKTGVEILNPSLTKILPVICAEADVRPEDTDAQTISAHFRIPLRVATRADVVQRQALLATDRAFKRLGVPLATLDPLRIAVFAATPYGLEIDIANDQRLKFQEWINCNSPYAAELQALGVQGSSDEDFNEDTIPGGLNNVVSGRVANYFNLRGKNYNCDVSFPMLQELAEQELGKGETDLVVMIFKKEEGGGGGHCQIASTAAFALAHDLPLLRQLNGQPYQGVDYSKIAFVFPGQGVWSLAEMQEWLPKLAAFSPSFDKADRVGQEKLGVGVREFLQNPERFEAQRQRILNLALFVFEVALADLLRKTLTPMAVTGHSFGEFAALVSAGIVDYEAMLHFICEREIASPAPFSEGRMIAIRESAERVRMIDPTLTIANRNAPLQTVIAVSLDDEERVLDKLRSERVPHMVLKHVPQPYHSPLMQNTTDHLREYLKHHPIPINPSTLLVRSSVRPLLIQVGERIEPDLLAEQVSAPVDFVAQIRDLYEQAYHFIEISPRSVFTQMIKEILGPKTFKAVTANEVLAGRRAESGRGPVREIVFEHQKFLNLIRKVIHTATGYNVQSITVEDRLQDDLGIDSIKKTEIVFKSLEAEQTETGKRDASLPEIDLSRIETVGDMVDFLADVDSGASHESRFFIRDQGKAHRTPQFAYFVPQWNPEPVSEDVSTKPNTFEIPDLDLHAGLCHVQQKLASSSQPFVVVVRGQETPLSRATIALLKSAKKDEQVPFFKVLHVRTDADPSAVERFAASEFADPHFAEVRYDRVRSVLSYQAWIPGSYTAQVGTIVALGGATGIGFHLLRGLQSAQHTSLALVGRRAIEDPQVSASLGEFAQVFRAVQYYQCDAADRVLLQQTLQTIHSNYGPIQRVLNMTGSGKTGLLRDKTADQLKSELDSKLAPALNLAAIAGEFDIGHVIHFSSVIAAFGLRGETVYSFANAAIEGLVAEWPRPGRATYVQWPGWENVGMTAKSGVTASLRRSHISLLKTDDAVTLFNAVVWQTDLPAGLILLDALDSLKYTFGLHDFARLGQDLGQRHSDREAFQKTYSLKHQPYLSGHRVTDQVYLPLALATGHFLGLAQMLGLTHGVLERIEARVPFIVEPVETRDLWTIFGESKNGFALSLASSIKHFVAELDPLHDDFVVPTWPGFAADVTPKRITRDKIYGDTALFHAGCFQVLDEVFYDDEALLETTLKIGPHLEPFWLAHPLLLAIEAAQQCLGLKSFLNFKHFGLSRSIEQLFFDLRPPVTSRIHVHIRITAKTSDAIVGDARILNDHGACLASLVGNRIEYAKGRTQNPF